MPVGAKKPGPVLSVVATFGLQLCLLVAVPGCKQNGGINLASKDEGYIDLKISGSSESIASHNLVALRTSISTSDSSTRYGGGDDGDSQAAQRYNLGDSVYGPQYPGGACPGIPKEFKRTHLVSSFDEFVEAYRSIRPGEAIVVRDGVYAWDAPKTSKYGRGAPHPFILDRGGKANNRIYIISESLHGAKFVGSDINWVFEAPNIVFAGFYFDRSGSIYLRAPDNRIACNYFTNGRTYVLGENKGPDRTEIDNNIIDGSYGVGMSFLRCNPLLSTCLSNPKGYHIHHNAFINKEPGAGNAHEAIMLGLGYSPVKGARTYNADGENMDSIIENNLFKNWQGENELISIKSSHNIIRNNCVVDSRGNFKTRNGSNNLITGNWISNAGPFEVSGTGNYYVFNYLSLGYPSYAFRLHPGEAVAPGDTDRHRDTMIYVQASDGEMSYNVIGNASGLVQVRDRWGATFVENPKGNRIRGNHIYSSSYMGSAKSGGYLNSDGHYTEMEFRKNNDWGKQVLFDFQLKQTECGDPDLFRGPHGPQGPFVKVSPKLLGEGGSVHAPSWW